MAGRYWNNSSRLVLCKFKTFILSLLVVPLMLALSRLEGIHKLRGSGIPEISGSRTEAMREAPLAMLGCRKDEAIKLGEDPTLGFQLLCMNVTV